MLVFWSIQAVTKAVTKQEGPKIFYLAAPFLIFHSFNN